MPRSHSTHHPNPHAAAAEPFTLDGLTELLRSKGLRMTGKRRAILQVLLKAKEPLGLEQIQSEAVRYAQGDEPPDFATVFRMMVVLEELKLARKVNLGRASSYFELADSRHHRDHLVCTDCGTVTPLEGSCPVETLERQIARKHGYTQVTHSLEFFGRCGDCSTGASS